MIRECIILAGGLGTRLQGAVPDRPKCLAPVAGRPFLFHVINYWRSQGIDRFVLSLGYRHEQIEAYLREAFPTLRYELVIEAEPLGTGGAIQRACRAATGPDVVVVNGDTLFRADLHAAFRFHESHQSECTLLLKGMHRFDRYGVVELDTTGLIKAFREKNYYESGLINAGVYLLHLPRFLDEELPEKFAFETEYLERFCDQRRIYGIEQDAYFIDIGIPEDYHRADRELRTGELDLSKVDRNWTLFLDRDGVINYEKKMDYILNWEEFRFYPGVPEALAKLSRHFGTIVVVSNQRGVGRGLMTEAELRNIHEQMRSEIWKAGGRIDGIYYCTSTDNTHPERKPNPGMAFRARQEHPAIDLQRSVMAGNKHSDMRFARNAGLYSIFIATTDPEFPFPDPDTDLRFDSLADFANSL